MNGISVKESEMIRIELNEEQLELLTIECRMLNKLLSLYLSELQLSDEIKTAIYHNFIANSLKELVLTCENMDQKEEFMHHFISGVRQLSKMD